MALILHSKRQWNVYRTLNMALPVTALSDVHSLHLIMKVLLNVFALIPRQPPEPFLPHPAHVLFHRKQDGGHCPHGAQRSKYRMIIKTMTLYKDCDLELTINVLNQIH